MGGLLLFLSPTVQGQPTPHRSPQVGHSGLSAAESRQAITRSGTIGQSNQSLQDHQHSTLGVPLGLPRVRASSSPPGQQVEIAGRAQLGLVAPLVAQVGAGNGQQGSGRHSSIHSIGDQAQQLHLPADTLCGRTTRDKQSQQQRSTTADLDQTSRQTKSRRNCKSNFVQFQLHFRSKLSNFLCCSQLWHFASTLVHAYQANRSRSGKRDLKRANEMEHDEMEPIFDNEVEVIAVDHDDEEDQIFYDARQESPSPQPLNLLSRNAPSGDGQQSPHIDIEHVAENVELPLQTTSLKARIKGCKVCNRSPEPYIFRPLIFETFNSSLSRHDIPHARSGHRIAANKHYVYSFGGFNPSIPANDPIAADPLWESTKPLFCELWRFSKTTRHWKKIMPAGSPPRQLVSHSQVLWDDSTLVVFGGSGMPFGQTSSNKIYKCDLRNHKWTLVKVCNRRTEPEHIPPPAYGQAMVVDHKRAYIYVCGGTNGFDYSLEVHRFDWKRQKWRKLCDSPSHIEARYRHEIALWDNKLFVIGGGTRTESFANDLIPVFDLVGKKWSTCLSNAFIDDQGNQCYPASRYSHDCGQLADRIYMVGGTNDLEVFDDLWCLHLPTLQWTRFECRLPKPLYFHSAAISDQGELSVFGGVTSVTTKERSNSIYSVWLQIPSLQTLCKQALVFSLKQRSIHGKDLRDHPKHTPTHRLSKESILTVFDIEDHLISNRVNPDILDLPHEN